MRGVPLQPRNKRNPHPTGEVGVFAVGFLPESPAGIPENLEVRRPVRQSGDAAGRVSGGQLRDRVVALGFTVLGASFRRNRVRDRMDEVDIPRRAKPYWVPGRPWRFSLPRLAAPRCTRYPRTRYRGSVVLHLQ